MLLLTPCIGFCGLFAVGKVAAGRTAKERKAAGERFVAELEAGADAGHHAPEHFTYRAYPDGGYALFFAEPAYGLPTDFFYVWDRGEKAWDLVEYAELPPE